jgi:hypothetical protein
MPRQSKSTPAFQSHASFSAKTVKVELSVGWNDTRPPRKSPSTSVPFMLYSSPRPPSSLKMPLPQPTEKLPLVAAGAPNSFVATA